MFVLGFDVETTGLNKESDVIIEVAAVLFDVQKKVSSNLYNWEVTESLSYLVYEYSYPEISKEITKINKITKKMLEEEGLPFKKVLEFLTPLFSKAEMILAHNKIFDQTMLFNQIKRMQYQDDFKSLNVPPWVCSLADNKAVSSFKSKKLSHLALDMGVAIDPATLHRAYDDVVLMGKMMERIPVSPQELLAYSQEPSIVIRAHIKPPWEDNGKGKDEAVSLGYSWETPRGESIKYEKSWVKKIKSSELDEETNKASFPVKLIGRI